MSHVQRYGAQHEGHAVELEFDRRRMVVNKAILRVDGEVVDSARIFYGDSDLKTTLDDGTEIAVTLHSGMMGELTRAQVKAADGSWRDLVAVE
jgi:hypothetical protein